MYKKSQWNKSNAIALLQRCTRSVNFLGCFVLNRISYDKNFTKFEIFLYKLKFFIYEFK